MQNRMFKQYSTAGRPDLKPLGSLRSRTEIRTSVKLFGFAILVFSAWGFAPTFVDAMAEKRAYDQSTSEAEQIGILEDMDGKEGRHVRVGRGGTTDGWTGSVGDAIRSRRDLGHSSSLVAALCPVASVWAFYLHHQGTPNLDQATVAPKPSPRQKGTVTWHKTNATFYGTGDQKPMPGQINYDDGKKRKTANGAVYKSDGLTCAAWTGGSGERIPLGTKIEVRRGNVSLILTVTDRQRSRTNRYLDLPTKTWAKLGAKYSDGKVAVEWRKL